MKKNSILLFFLICCSCASHSPSPEPSVGNKRILEIAIGSSSRSLKQGFGAPTRITDEKFPGEDYLVWEYGDEAKPTAYFTIDPKSQQIVGKSVWIYESDPDYDLDVVLKRSFSGNHFEKYIPCHARAQEQVIVDRKNGISIASQNQKVGLISWSNPHLTQLRVNQFHLKCPQLQEMKRSDD